MQIVIHGLVLIAFAAASGAAVADPAVGTASGLPVPRFVSLKTDKVAVRGGPNKTHDIKWLFQRSGLPVEITAEFETWRRIRDADGAEGWVYHSLLSGRRTGVVTASSKGDELIPLYDKPDVESAVVAKLEPGVLGQVRRCHDGWCRLIGRGFEGWVYHSLLSGRRTGVVTASSKDRDELIPLYDKPDVESAVVAKLEPGVLGQVRRCHDGWCRVSGRGFEGWVRQVRLWGVYPNEKVE